MRIVIPMAGQGSRFVKAGFTFPKPLIDVNGKTMIQQVVENLDDGAAEFIFLVRKDHLDDYNLDAHLRLITGNRATIVQVDSVTEGAACTVLLAEKHILHDDQELIIANCDQVVRFSRKNFDTLRTFTSGNIIFTFNATHPKWSFAEIDDIGQITRVVEKEPISDVATCGIYHFRWGSAFVKAAKLMMRDDSKRVNNEWYVAPVYNELIARGDQVLPFYVDQMHGIGTPEDLETYVKHYE